MRAACCASVTARAGASPAAPAAAARRAGSPPHARGSSSVRLACAAALPAPRQPSRRPLQPAASLGKSVGDEVGGAWIDLTKLVTGGGGKRSPYDELAAEIGKQRWQGGGLHSCTQAPRAALRAKHCTTACDEGCVRWRVHGTAGAWVGTRGGGCTGGWGRAGGPRKEVASNVCMRVFRCGWVGVDAGRNVCRLAAKQLGSLAARHLLPPSMPATSKTCCCIPMLQRVSEDVLLLSTSKQWLWDALHAFRNALAGSWCYMYWSERAGQRFADQGTRLVGVGLEGTGGIDLYAWLRTGRSKLAPLLLHLPVTLYPCVFMRASPRTYVVVVALLSSTCMLTPRDGVPAYMRRLMACRLRCAA
eukprot:366281-Chlamydomonas_euryale.AAC.25